MSMQQRPLSGMRVIELAHIMAGPLCGMMLADMGADVIKVEKIELTHKKKFFDRKYCKLCMIPALVPLIRTLGLN